jgi:hypothetical protein
MGTAQARNMRGQQEKAIMLKILAQTVGTWQVLLAAAVRDMAHNENTWGNEGSKTSSEGSEDR